MLCGGDKSTQSRDIERAHYMAEYGRKVEENKITDAKEKIEVSDEDLRLSPYDSADYLQDEEDIRLYLEAAQKEGGDDPACMMRVLGAIARARNMNQLAKKAGIPRVSLYRALAPGAKPRIDTVMKIAGALGIKLQMTM